MRRSIHYKLVAGFGLCILLMIVLVGYHYVTLLKLEKLYFQALKRTTDMELATDAQHVGQDLYVIIANTVINRDLAKSERDWAASKQETRAKLRQVAAAADTPDEHLWVGQAEEALEDIIRIFEQQMLPLIREGGTVPGNLSVVDAQVDKRIEDISRAMTWVAKSLSDENQAAAKEFRGVLTESISFGLVFSLIALIAALSISTLTTRRIVRPVSELTRAVIAVEKGNYNFELNHQSDDETGVLAGAFRKMAERVRQRTAELLESKERLEHEINVRKLAEEQLQKAHDELDDKVKERTAELARANIELQRIPSRLIETQEEERKRLAVELHDSIGQTLAAIKFRIETVIRLKDLGDLDSAFNNLEQFVPTIQHAIAETRNIYMGLRPSMLDHVGLLATLDWLLREFMKYYPKIHVELTTGIMEEDIPEDLKICIFRVAQESLNNVAKHSRAEWVDLSLSRNGESIELAIADDGIGADLNAILSNAGCGASLGLTGMKERVELTRGMFSFDSIIGQGTTIRAFWPIEVVDQADDGCNDGNSAISLP